MANRKKRSKRIDRIGGTDSKLIKTANIQVLKNMGVSLRKMAKVLDLDYKTIKRYEKLDTNPELLAEFKKGIIQHLTMQDWDIAKKVTERLKFRVTDEEAIKKVKTQELTNLYKVVKDSLNPSEVKTNNTAIQINITKENSAISVE